ncbi:MAG TPA: NAD-dependent epimerase/dehydratase family protein [bacterium]|jgi:UDP-glucuronate 4-epimerase
MNDFNTLRVLVTGGAGFIGSHLCEALLTQGAKVAVLDNFDPFYPRASKEQNLAFCRSLPGFSLVEGDLRDADLVGRLFGEFRPQAVVHLAARAGVRPSLDDPALYADVNVRGTTVLLEAAHLTGVKNFVFASSSSVYGNRNTVPFRESDNTDFAVSPYGATKKAGEVLCHSYHQVYGISTACLRFFTVYGPRQRPDLAIRKFVRLALAGESIPVFGDGTTRRDYTHVRDILTGILGAIRWGQSPEPRYGIFNLGSSHPIELRELISLIGDCIGHPVETKSLPFQPGDVVQTFADSSLAEQELGFKHDVNFRDGLKDFVAWMKQQTEG